MAQATRVDLRDLLICRSADYLTLRANQFAHLWHIGCIARECQAPKLPATLDRRKHRIVVISHAGSARGVIRVRDGQRDYVAPTRIGVAAATGINEREAALIPGNEDDRVAVPGTGVHNLVDR